MIKNTGLFVKSLLTAIFGLVLLGFYVRFKNEVDIQTFVSPELWEGLFLFLGILFAGAGLFGILLSFFAMSNKLK